ncbi:MAG: 2Fe-2S iron-sulfur cluster binding domain-containing protein [Pseudomonadota bacterium]
MSSSEDYPEVVVFRAGASRVRAQYFPGETLLDTARRAGLSIPTSCELGDCGTCMVELLAGSVHMKNNNALSPDEVQSGCVLSCQGIPAGERCVVRTN